ncbi:putative class V chitinase [Mycena rebaudengoi]|nr:putative class V chitinase [Mycena rebaudengoi]
MRSSPTLFLAVLTLFFSLSVAQDFSCSPTKPCPIGCCGNSGICGLGPTFCGAGNCTSTCDAKSDCDPGWGAKWSNAEKCPLNVCCSEFGFCGTTSMFCGNATVRSPSCSGGSSSNQRTIGYYEGWSNTRACDQMYPENLPIGAYTHLNFAFAFIDPQSFAVAPMDSGHVELYSRLTNLKNRSPGLQVWISIGGWSMNDPDQPTATTFSDLAGSADAQKKFFTSLISFMSTYGFDGVDIDWEYPVAPERSGRPADFANYPTFLENLKNAFAASGHSYGLSITIPSSFWYLQHFDVVKIAKTIDWFNMMTYDLHGTWDSTDPFIGAIVGAHTNLTEIDLALQLLWRNNIDPSKVVLGLGFYGRSFTLTNPSCTTAGCPFSGGAPAGECTANVGTLSFPEIKRIIAAGGKVTLDKNAAVKIVTYGGNNWVSYDDSDTFKLKIDYANNHCLGGTMIWAASLDDKTGAAAGTLGSVTGRSALSLKAVASTEDPITSCVFSDCGLGDNCPAGTRPVIVANHPDKSAAIGISEGNNACRDEWNGEGDTRLQRVFCCPPNNAPTCRWDSRAPFCTGHCNDDEIQIATGISGDGSECWTGHKTLCCKKTTSDKDWGACKWEGSAPFCPGAGCKESDRKLLTTTTWGQGGEQPCSLTGVKSYCCTQPPPFTGCVWNKHGDDTSFFQNPFICQGKCPAGKQLVATDIGSCIWGSQAFCCDTEEVANNPALKDFQDKLTAFKQDPTCSAMGSKRQSAGFDSALGLAPLIAGSSLRSTGLDLLLSDTFDDQFGNANNMHFDNFITEQARFPGFDIVDLIFDALCQGTSWVTGFKDYGNAHDSVCVINLSHVTKRSLNETEAQSRKKRKRNFWMNNDLTSEAPGRPTTGALINAIIAGAIRPAYVAIEQLGQNQANHLLVEVAWDIRNFPDLQEGPGDIVAVMHMHVDNLAFANGHTYLGVQFASFFHAQGFYLQHGNRYRAIGWNTNDPNDALNTNERAGVVECDREEEDRWWVGQPGVGNQNDPVTRLGNALVTQTIVNDNLLAGMFNPATYVNDRGNTGSPLFVSWGFNWNSQAGEVRLRDTFLVPAPNAGEFLPTAFPGSLPPPNPPSNPPWGGGDPFRKRVEGALGEVWKRASRLAKWAVDSVWSVKS